MRQHDVDGDRLGAGVRQLDVPVPARQLRAESQAQVVVDRLVAPGDDDVAAAEGDDGVAAGAEQGPPPDAVRPVHPEVDVGQAGLRDGRGVEQQARAEGVEAAQGAVREHLGGEPGATLEVEHRSSGQDGVVIEHPSFLPR